MTNILFVPRSWGAGTITTARATERPTTERPHHREGMRRRSDEWQTWWMKGILAYKYPLGPPFISSFPLSSLVSRFSVTRHLVDLFLELIVTHITLRTITINVRFDICNYKNCTKHYRLNNKRRNCDKIKSRSYRI